MAQYVMEHAGISPAMLGHACLTHLGRYPIFLPPFDYKDGLMQKKNCQYGDGNCFSIFPVP